MTKMVRWTPEGLQFWRRWNGRSERVAEVRFERGPLGPYANLVGSPSWQQVNNWSEAWARRGYLPPVELLTGT